MLAKLGDALTAALPPHCKAAAEVVVPPSFRTQATWWLIACTAVVRLGPGLLRRGASSS
jgi:hypothetical protein